MNCKHKGCDRPSRSKGYCSKHYQQLRKHGEIKNNTKADFNEIEIKEDYVNIILTNKNGQIVGKSQIDKEDLPKVNKVRWGLTSRGYVYNCKVGMLHRVIMGVKDDNEVDHENNKPLGKLNNRKSNLRPATRSQNCSNRSVWKKSKTGYKGVTFDTKAGQYRARISKNGKQHFLGYFDDPEKAHKAYAQASKNLHKEFANDGR